MSGFFVNYAIIVTVPLVGKLTMMRNNCRIDWIIFNHNWMAKMVSWGPGMMHFPVVYFTILGLYTFINRDLKQASAASISICVPQVEGWHIFEI